MFLRNNFCPRCGNDLKGVMRPTLVSEENLKKREIWMQKYIAKGEENVDKFFKRTEKRHKRDIKKHPEAAEESGGKKHE
jgi:hypothetical protein